MVDNSNGMSCVWMYWDSFQHDVSNNKSNSVLLHSFARYFTLLLEDTEDVYELMMIHRG